MRKVRTTFSRRVGLAGLLLLTLAALAGLTWRSTSASDEAGFAFRQGNLVRLHIVANSDRPADQRVKLQIRDDLIREAGHLFRDVSDPAEARRLVQLNLPLFRTIAERRLRSEGFSYPVAVHYGVYGFPARTYGELTLPAGDYTAVRLVLGEGKGRNWWCVLFPPLCFLEADSGIAKNRVKMTPAEGRQVAVRVKVGLPRSNRLVPLSVLTSAAWR